MNNWLINRNALEILIGKKLTEEEWAQISEEVAGRVDNFIDEILPEIITDTLGVSL